MSILRTENLVKRYGNMLALNEVSLQVGEGDIYGFLGPNGAGKTTAIRIILRLLTPDSGDVELFGHNLEESITDVIFRIGVVFGRPGFYPHLTGKENLQHVANILGSSMSPRQALKQVSLLDSASKNFDDYSTGMKQRLAMAAAFLKDPDLYLLDEPTNGLDPQGRIEVRETIQKLGEEGKTVFLSSHLLNEVQQVCDRVGVLKEGELIAEQGVDQLLGEEDRMFLTVDADRKQPARQVLESRGLGKEFSLTEDGLTFVPLVDNNSELLSALSEEGIEVHEFGTGQKDLEDVFIELTS